MAPGHEPPSGSLGAAILGILRHLAEHPQAKDTIPGIHSWWLPDGGERWDGGDVEQAIRLLVARGWMEERTLAGQAVYGLRRDRFDDRLDEITRWLQENHG